MPVQWRKNRKFAQALGGYTCFNGCHKFRMHLADPRAILSRHPFRHEIRRRRADRAAPRFMPQCRNPALRIDTGLQLHPVTTQGIRSFPVQLRTRQRACVTRRSGPFQHHGAIQIILRHEYHAIRQKKLRICSSVAARKSISPGVV